MASDDVVRFQFPNHEVSVLKRMNQLRLEERFCDVTIVADRLRFPGHRVVLAACSPFLRDQFHMNPSQEVQVFPMTGAQIVRRLLLSCYTGALEFPFNDILDYLTAASCLQMEHVVEKCRQSLSPRIGPPVPVSQELGEGRPGTPQIATSSERAPEGEKMAAWGEEAEKGPGGRTPPDDAVKLEAEQRPDFGPAEDICIRKVESLADCMGGDRPARPGKGGTAEFANGLEPDSRIHSTVGGGGAEAAAGGYSDNGAPYDMSEVMISDDFQEEDYESSASEECRSSGFSGSFYRPGEEQPPQQQQQPPPLPGLGQPGKEGEVGSPTLCSECGDLFQHRAHLAAHMVVHKLYMCLLCGKVFKKNARLAQHINVHTGFKPYCCAICGRTFTQKRSLKDHMNVHNGDSPHCCNYCDMRFTHYSTLRVHLRDQHGKTTTRNLENKPAEISLVVP